MRATTDCNSAVDVDSHNLQGIGISAQGEFSTFGVVNNNAFSDTIITRDACPVVESSLFIDNELSVLLNCFYVCNERNIKYHVAMMRKTSWGMF
jgi:hypothetical protein